MSLRPSRDDEIKEMTERNGTQKSGTTGEHVRKRRGPRGKANKVLEFFLDFVSLSLSFHLPFIPSSSLYNISLLPRTEGKETVGTRPTKEGIPEMQEEEQSPFSSPPSSFEKVFFFSLYLLDVLLEEAPQAADANTI